VLYSLQRTLWQQMRAVERRRRLRRRVRHLLFWRSLPLRLLHCARGILLRALLQHCRWPAAPSWQGSAANA
jgi:hypothetical protein